MAEFKYPSVNMASTTPCPITKEEQPELFTTGPFHQQHDQQPAQSWTSQQFHVDFGANIIIVNHNKFFHTYHAQKECIEHIAGDTIPGIEGYGSIIIKLKHKLHVIRNVAYMPGNNKCTLSAHHLHRTNNFRSGMHSMHSCIKLIDADGFQTKLPIAEIKNGLDYVTMQLLPPCTNDITPEACSASKRNPSLSANLIHHKCAHYHYGRIQHLAHNQLITGLPKHLPAMDKPCPICIAMKSKNSHVKRKLIGLSMNQVNPSIWTSHSCQKQAYVDSPHFCP